MRASWRQTRARAIESIPQSSRWLRGSLADLRPPAAAVALCLPEVCAEQWRCSLATCPASLALMALPLDWAGSRMSPAGGACCEHAADAGTVLQASSYTCACLLQACWAPLAAARAWGMSRSRLTTPAAACPADQPINAPGRDRGDARLAPHTFWVTELKQQLQHSFVQLPLTQHSFHRITHLRQPAAIIAPASSQ